MKLGEVKSGFKRKLFHNLLKECYPFQFYYASDIMIRFPYNMLLSEESKQLVRWSFDNNIDYNYLELEGVTPTIERDLFERWN